MSMSVQAIGTAYNAPKYHAQAVPFKGENQGIMPQETPKKEKHLFKAIASAAFPGLALGQFLDGRFGSGFKHMFGLLALSLASKITAIAGVASKSKLGMLASMGASLACGIGAFATYVHSIVDAYKGGKA